MIKHFVFFCRGQYLLFFLGNLSLAAAGRGPHPLSLVQPRLEVVSRETSGSNRGGARLP